MNVIGRFTNIFVTIGLLQSFVVPTDTASAQTQGVILSGSETITTQTPYSVIDVDSIALSSGEVLSIVQPTPSSKMLIRVRNGRGLVSIDGGEINWNGTVCINASPVFFSGRLNGTRRGHNGAGTSTYRIDQSVISFAASGCSIIPERFFAGDRLLACTCLD